jgi:hypothetical protein
VSVANAAAFDRKQTFAPDFSNVQAVDFLAIGKRCKILTFERRPSAYDDDTHLHPYAMRLPIADMANAARACPALAEDVEVATVAATSFSERSDPSTRSKHGARQH